MSSIANALLSNHAELLGWQTRTIPVEPWRPEPLKHEQWPPNYKAVYAWRLKQVKLLSGNLAMQESAKAYYSTRPAEFIMDWMDTYNPRKPFDKWMPFVFFTKQMDFITYLHELRNDGESGLVEKCRDAGATWLSCAYSIWSWLFIPDDAIGWGSRKQDLVDKIGDPDSIFEKMRLILQRLPAFFLPAGFSVDKHATFMKIINPANGSIISGEAGDNIGRGGRKSIYFKDESAHYPRPELIEAALGNNTNVQIDISSVNGLGNVYHRRREAGIEWSPGTKIERGFVRVFVIDWSDHPDKTQEWYNLSRAKHEREGLMHLFAQEVERNYSAAVQNTIISQEWIRAAYDAHLKIGKPEDWLGEWSGALDVADEGLDRNAFVKREGLILRSAKEWGERDPGVTTRNIIGDVQQHKGIRIQYDCIGLGVTVKSEYNRLLEDPDSPVTYDSVYMVPWNAGDSVIDPAYHVIADDDNSPLNSDFFHNLKAQAWWSVRTRFWKTWRAVTQGVVYPVSELISIDSTIEHRYQLEKELAQPTIGKAVNTLRMLINKKPEGTRSPNIADAVVMLYNPMPENYMVAVQGQLGNG